MAAADSLKPAGEVLAQAAAIASQRPDLIADRCVFPASYVVDLFRELQHLPLLSQAEELVRSGATWIMVIHGVQLLPVDVRVLAVPGASVPIAVSPFAS